MRLPLPSDTSRKPGLSPVLLPLSSKLEVPMTPSSGPVSLLEQLPELRGTFYVTDRRFIVKGYNLRIVRQKRYTGQGMWEGGGQSSYAFGVCDCPQHLHAFPTWKLSKPRPFGVFWGASMIKSWTPGDRFNFHPLYWGRVRS